MLYYFLFCGFIVFYEIESPKMVTFMEHPSLLLVAMFYFLNVRIVNWTFDDFWNCDSEIDQLVCVLVLWFGQRQPCLLFDCWYSDFVINSDVFNNL